MLNNTEEQLTLFAVDFPAKTCQTLERKQALVEIVPVYIPKCLELLASVCPDTQFLKTCQDSLLETQVGGSDNFSMTWTRSGLMQNGIVSRLPTLAHRIGEIESGLLPTPTLDVSSRKKKYSQGGTPLSLALSKLKFLPTPTVSDAKGSPKSRTILNNKSNLCEVLRQSESDSIYPNPLFVEQMMGFPVGWTDLED
jgi:DNA (cytosine-5)-methyltransferase 1